MSESAIRVVAAGATALDLLARLHGACFDPGWSRESLARLLATPGALAFLAVTGDEAAAEPVGFLLARAAGGECEIISLGVVPAARRQGAARALLAATLAAAASAGARNCFLEVAADNAAARALYLGFGFREVGRRPGYYRNSGGAADAVVMARALG
jgi:ribosomal-protein-alanine N-acetyltransferase